MSENYLTKLTQNHQIGKILALPVNKKFTDGTVNKFYRFLLIYCSKIAHLTRTLSHMALLRRTQQSWSVKVLKFGLHNIRYISCNF